MDLKALVPGVVEDCRNGTPLDEALNKLGLSWGSRGTLKYHVERELGIPYGADETFEPTLIRPEKPKVKKYVVINGVRYRDITEDVVDCGG